MARILVFNSDPLITVDSANNPIPNNKRQVSTVLTAPSYTFPIRLFSPAGPPVKYVGWEFLLDPPGSSADVLALNWWQEFWCDRQQVYPGPSNRDWQDVNVNTPWMRETVEAGLGTGGMSSYGLTRKSYLLGTRNGSVGDSLYVPTDVHALWVRLGFYIDTADQTAAAGGTISVGGIWGFTADGAISAARFRVFAHVGGHAEVDYLYQHGRYPYVYNG